MYQQPYLSFIAVYGFYWDEEHDAWFVDRLKSRIFLRGNSRPLCILYVGPTLLPRPLLFLPVLAITDGVVARTGGVTFDPVFLLGYSVVVSKCLYALSKTKR